MLRMTWEAGIVDFGNCRVALQPLRYGLPALAMARHPQLQCLQAPHNQHRRQWGHHRAGHVLHANHSNVMDKVCAATDHARDEITMPAKVLCC